MFDTVDTLKMSLHLFAGMIETMQVRHANLEKAVKEDFSNATDLADYLVRKGLPFRQAHEVIGNLVLHCIEQGCYLADLTLADYKGFSELFESDLFTALDIRNVVNARNSKGGTGTESVKEQIGLVKAWLEND